MLVPLADGCEEIETVSIIDVLRRAGALVTVASITGVQTIKGSNGISFIAD